MIRGGPRVVVLAYPGADLLDVAGPCAVFDAFARAPGRSEEDIAPGVIASRSSRPGAARAWRPRAGSHWSSSAIICRSEGRSIRSSSRAGTGPGGRPGTSNSSVGCAVEWAPSASGGSGSVCTGAFVLAAAGLLDGRRATTHWQVCPRLARDHPAVAVEEDPIFVRDGNIYTSAGVTAGMDLALALVEEDHSR